MADDVPVSPKRRRGSFWRSAELRSIAEYLLDGPRAIMYPDDPRGKKFWFDKVIVLRSRTFLHVEETRSLYAVCGNLIEEGERDCYLRIAVWDTKGDRNHVHYRGPQKWPTVSIRHFHLDVKQARRCFEMLRKLEAALSTIEVRGPDLWKPRHVPIKNPRISRKPSVSYSVDYSWSNCGLRLSWERYGPRAERDIAFERLWRFIGKVSEIEASQARMSERFEFDPEGYAEMVRWDSHYTPKIRKYGRSRKTEGGEDITFKPAPRKIKGELLPLPLWKNRQEEDS